MSLSTSAKTNATYLSEHRRTGNHRFRLDWLGQVIIQTQVMLAPRKEINPHAEDAEVPYWRDATPYEINCELGDNGFFTVSVGDIKNPYRPPTGKRGFSPTFIGARMKLFTEYGKAVQVDGSGLWRVVENIWRPSLEKEIIVSRPFTFVKNNGPSGGHLIQYSKEGTK